MEFEGLVYGFAEFTTYLEWFFAISSVVYLFFRRIPKDLYFLVALFWAVIIQEEISGYLMENHMQNLFMFPVGVFIDLVLFFTLYIKFILYKGQYRIALFLPALIGVYLLYYDFIGVFAGDITNHLMMYGTLFLHVFILGLSLIYFVQVAVVRNFKIVPRHLVINLMVFLVFSVNVLFTLSTSFLVTESIELVSLFWLGRIIIFTLSNIVYYYLIWRNGKTRKPLRLA